MQNKDFTVFLNDLADASQSVIEDYFRSHTKVIDKEDESPVTQADRETEQTLRALIEQAFPEDGIFGEEFGIKEGRNQNMWVLDPIDGTRSFICGAPWFGTLIALLEDKTPTWGVIDIPMMKERWIGNGQKTYLNDKLCRTRHGVELDQASLFTTDLDLFSEDQRRAFDKVKTQAKCTRYGTDCYAYGLLAAGHIDLVVEAGLKPYDAMALVPVIQGAGGIVTGWNGEDVTLDWDGRILASADVALHKKVLNLLNQ